MVYAHFANFECIGWNDSFVCYYHELHSTDQRIDAFQAEYLGKRPNIPRKHDISLLEEKVTVFLCNVHFHISLTNFLRNTIF